MGQREHLLKIGVSGIRGVVGEFLTPALAAAFGQAFGTYVGRGRVVVGRDTRSSGEMLQHAVQCGLLAAGCEVIDVGVQPTPTIQIYTAAKRARGGLALTASHNPPEYNALKLFNQDGLFFNQYERSELLDLYHQSDFYEATNREIGLITSDYDGPVELHLGRVLRFVDADLIRSRRFRVALDGVNGAGSRMSVRFLEKDLQCDLRAIAVDPTKPFPRIAEPRPDTLGDLQELVRRTGAEIGFAQDPDGDRLAVCDEHGDLLDNDDVLALVVESVLDRYPGPVVVNLTTSAAIDDIAKQHESRVDRAPVGEANVVECMLANKAVIGGEGSNGGIIFPGVHLCRDSYTGMAFLLNRLAQTGKSISELAAALPQYYRRLDKAPFTHGRLGGLIQDLQRDYSGARVDHSDGLKLTWDDHWIHLRASNTEPVLRLAVEARTQGQLDEVYRELMQRLTRG